MTTHIVFTDEASGDSISVSGQLTGYARKSAANTFDQLNTFSAGVIVSEVAAAPAAVANAVVLYALDNGSGKTKLMARFPTGSPVQLGIEP